MAFLEHWHFYPKVKSTFILLLLLIAAFFLMLPTLKLPFSLIDDGESIRVAQLIQQSLANHQWQLLFDTLIEKDFGRIRAAYWLYQWAYYHIFGLSAFGHHLGRLFITLFLMTLVYLISLLATKKNIIAFLSTIFFFFFFPAMENYVRLGPAEIPQLVFFLPIVLSLIYLTKRTKPVSFFGLVIVFISLVIVFLVKENSIILTPLLFSIWWFNRSRKQISHQLLSIFIFSLCLSLSMVIASLIIRHTSGNYSTWYRFDVETVKYSLFQFLYIFRQSLGVLIIFIPLSFLRLILRFLIHKINPLDQFQIICWVWFFSGFILQLPWSFPLGRYLVTFLPGLAIALSIEIFVLFSVIKPQFTRYLLLSGVIIFFLVKNLFGYFNYFSDYYARETTNHAAIKYLSQNTPPNGFTYLTLSLEPNAIEWFVETSLHNQQFYQRPDIIVKRVDPEFIELNSGLLASWSEYPQFNKTELKNILDLNQARHLTTFSAQRTVVYCSPLRYLKHLLLTGFTDAQRTIIRQTKTYRWDIYQI